MPSSTLQFPLEAFLFDGVTFITSVESRAYIQRVESADGADFEMCALYFFPHLFTLTPRVAQYRLRIVHLDLTWILSKDFDACPDK